MGDSRVIVCLADLRPANARTARDVPPLDGSSSSQTRRRAQRRGEYRTYDRIFSADATLRDVMDAVRHTIVPDAFPALAVDVGNDDDDEEGESGGGVLAVYDCTLHPPKDMADLLKCRGTDRTGPRSITLHDLGWYPGGRIVVVRSDDDEAREGVVRSSAHIWDEDYAYNLPSAAGSGSDVQRQRGETAPGSRVELAGTLAEAEGGDSGGGAAGANKPLPSELFRAVASRFDGDEDDDLKDDNDDDTGLPRRKVRKNRTEAERCARIDATLRSLDAKQAASGKKKGKSNKKVSDQVRKMLVKSRSVGDKKLRMEDRIHLETVLVDESSSEDIDDMDQEGGEDAKADLSHRFFSKMATAGRIASTVAGSLGPTKTVELLVSRPTGSLSSLEVASGEDGTSADVAYRRLPATMTLYEAINGGYVSDFDRVVVRVFSVSPKQSFSGGPVGDAPSLSVLDEDKEGGSRELDSSDDRMDICDNQNAALTDSTRCNSLPASAASNVAAGAIDVGSGSSYSTDKQMFARIKKAIDDVGAASNNNKKKNSATSEKVRQMLMKGKAKGDKKAVKEVDRFYAEVIAVDDFNVDVTPTATSTFVFISRKADLGQLVIPSEDGGFATEILVTDKCNDGSDTCGTCQRLAKSLRICDAEAKGLIHNFGRLVIRKFPSHAAQKKL